MIPIEDLSEKDRMDAFYAMNEFFIPRPHWAASGPFDSDDKMRLLAVLVAATHADLVTITRTDIECVKVPNRWARHRYEDDASECEFEFLASNRRGNDDLKDHTWSAYCHLKNSIAGGNFVAQRDNAPYYYVETNSGFMATAGNVEPDQILKAMVQNKCSKLGLVRRKRFYKRDYYTESDDLEMSVLHLEPKPLSMLKNIFDKEEKEREIFRLKRFPPPF